MIKLKPTTEQLIRTVCIKGASSANDKLQAIYKLIQTKGTPITGDDERLNGVMALTFAKGEHIAMIRTGQKDKFFPCAMRVIYLEDIKTN